jgi:hypothetical protein
MRSRVRRATVLCLAALSLALVPAAHAGEGWWGKLDEGEAVSLADIAAKPRDFLGRTVTFACIKHKRTWPARFSPMTPFNPKRHDNLAVWPDGAPLWTERAFKNHLSFIYIERNHVQRDELRALETFERIEITGKVRDVLRGAPCIEVFSFRKTGHRLGRRAVENVIAGDNHARLGTRRGDQRAARRYLDALEPDLAPVYDMLIRKRAVEAFERIGDHETAQRLHRGELLGGASMPKPLPADDEPEPPPMPFTEPAPPADNRTSHELPGTTLPPPALPSGELPGTAGFPPAPPLPAGDVPGGDDLPGVPVGPATPPSELPGVPSGNDGRFVPPAPRLPDDEQPAPERPSGPKGVPPKRRPRLSGVK